MHAPRERWYRPYTRIFYRPTARLPPFFPLPRGSRPHHWSRHGSAVAAPIAPHSAPQSASDIPPALPPPFSQCGTALKKVPGTAFPFAAAGTADLLPAFPHTPPRILP